MRITSPVDIAGRRVLVVEKEVSLAANMIGYVHKRGGEAVGPIATPEAALAALDSWRDLDAAMVDIETANGLVSALVRKFEERGVAVLWIVGDDGWFFDPDEEASVYRLEGDAEAVLRVEWPLR